MYFSPISHVLDEVSALIITESIRNIKVLELFLINFYFRWYYPDICKKEILRVYFSPTSHIWDEVSVFIILGSIKNVKLLDPTLTSC